MDVLLQEKKIAYKAVEVGFLHVRLAKLEGVTNPLPFNHSSINQQRYLNTTTSLNINRIHTRKLIYSFSNTRIAKNLM